MLSCILRERNFVKETLEGMENGLEVFLRFFQHPLEHGNAMC